MRKTNILMVAGACVATLALLAPAAMAEPAGNPATRVLAGTGSDTTQDVLNGLSNVPASGSRIIGSYDASGSATLAATKVAVAGSDCTGIARPVGSTAGVRALRDQRAAAITAGRRPCLDYARSSSNGSQSTDFAGTGLTWIPFAGDAVSYVTRIESTIPTTLTTAQLAAIYNCTATATTVVPPTIVPLLPQASSGTRAFFLASIGVTTPGSCVQTADPTDPSVQLIENTGNRLTLATHIAPYSVAQFQAQYYKVITDVKGSTELRRVNGIVPTSTAFPYQREVYNVVPTSELADPTVESTFVGSDDPTDICNSTDVLTRFGFTLLPAGRCGAVVATLQTPGGAGTDLPGPVN